MAASDPTTDVPTPTGTLQGVAAFNWDGTNWQPTGGAGPSVATPTGVLRGVAAFNGGPAWQPAGLAQPSVATPTGTLDGVAVYTWSGSAWTPPGGTATPSTPSGALRGVAAFNWDGAAWQPAGQAGPSVATPYGVLDGVAMFNWTGSAWAAVGAPSLDLSFMIPGTLDPRITFTRASTATYFDATGTMQTAAINAPRWDYNPSTLTLQGLLIEEQRTNLLLNTAALGTQSVTVAAQPYVLSFYGTGTITKSGAATGALVGTGAFPQRVWQLFTPTAGTLTLTVTGSVLNAQLESSIPAGNSRFPTSYIPTTGVAVTRSVDNASMPTNVSWFSSAVTSLFAEYMVTSSLGQTATGYDVCGLSDGTATNKIVIRGQNSAATTSLFYSTVAGTSTLSTAVGPLTAGVAAKFAAMWNGTVARGVLNGGAVQSYSSALPAGINALAIGNQTPGGTAPLNGYIRRVRYWPRALSDAELQQVTT